MLHVNHSFTKIYKSESTSTKKATKKPRDRNRSKSQVTYNIKVLQNKPSKNSTWHIHRWNNNEETEETKFFEMALLGEARRGVARWFWLNFRLIDFYLCVYIIRWLFYLLKEKLDGWDWGCHFSTSEEYGEKFQF